MSKENLKQTEVIKEETSSGRAKKFTPPEGATTLREFELLPDTEKLEIYNKAAQYEQDAQKWVETANVAFNFATYRDNMREHGWYRAKAKGNETEFFLEASELLRRIYDPEGDLSMFKEAERLRALVQENELWENKAVQNQKSPSLNNSDVVYCGECVVSNPSKINTNISNKTKEQLKMYLQKYSFLSQANIIEIALKRLFNDIDNGLSFILGERP